MTAAPVDQTWQHGEDLKELLEQVWESLTEIPSALDFSSEHFEVASGTPLMTADVAMRGDWVGRVRLRCTVRTAKLIAALMLALPTDALDEEDVDGALGEVANIIGGNVKSFLDGVEVLSLPEVSRVTSPLASDVDDDDHIYSCLARWQDEQLLVQVRQGS